ncbi:S9 family peptidase [Pseudomonas mucidolens]|uniref:S9 family peptidase n=1 Tax=Pseudomonas mucidolens TaxID=46679 RepID=UPI0030DD2ACC
MSDSREQRVDAAVQRYFPPPTQRPGGANQVHWDPDGEHYVRLVVTDSGCALERYAIGRAARETWVAARQLRDAEGVPLAVESVQVQFEHERVLLFTDAQRLWRSACNGRYWLFDRPTQRLVRVARDQPERMIAFAKMSPRGQRVAYVRDHDIYCEEPGVTPPWRLTWDGDGNRWNGEFDWGHEEGFGCRDGFRWAPDGRHIAFWQFDSADVPRYEIAKRAGEAQPGKFALAYSRPADPVSRWRIGVVEVDTGAIRWMPRLAHPDYLPRMQWLDHETLLFQALDRTQQDYRLLRWRLPVERFECIYHEYDPAWIDMIAYDMVTDKWAADELPVNPDGTAVYRLSDQDGWRRIYRVCLLDGSAEAVSPVGFDVARLYGIGSECRLLYFCASPHAAGQRYLYALDLAQAHALRRLTPQRCVGVNHYEIGPGGRFAVHRFSSPDSGACTALIGLPSHAALSPPVRGAGVDAQPLGARVLAAQLGGREGLYRDVRCLLPPGFEAGYAYPLVFLVYGYPMTQQVSDGYPSRWSRFLADLGYLVVVSDPLGTPCLKGRSWRKGIKHRLGVDNCADQADICRRVATWPQVDPERIAVFGWSEGGTMVLNLLAANPGLFRAGIAVAPMANPLLHYGIYQERYRGLLSTHASAYQAGSPQFSPTLVQDKLLILHGDADDHVHLQHSTDYWQRFNDSHALPELKIYQGSSHAMSEGAVGLARVAGDLGRFLEQQVRGGKGRVVAADLKAYLTHVAVTDDHGAIAAGQRL